VFIVLRGISLKDVRFDLKICDFDV
jgi:hypothetical protein